MLDLDCWHPPMKITARIAKIEAKEAKKAKIPARATTVALAIPGSFFQTHRPPRIPFRCGQPPCSNPPFAPFPVPTPLYITKIPHLARPPSIPKMLDRAIHSKQAKSRPRLKDETIKLKML